VAMFRQVSLACLAAALAAGAAGCGSSGGTGPLASDSAPTVVSEAMANTIAAQSVTITGGPTAALAVDLTIVHGLGCTGTIVQNSVQSTVIWIGKTVYARSTGMPANEWMRGTTTDPNLQGLLALCQPANMLAGLSASGFSDATRSATVYHGQPALSLTIPGSAQGSGKPGTVVVTDTASPVLLNISGSGPGSVTFSGYGATKTIAPPAS